MVGVDGELINSHGVSRLGSLHQGPFHPVTTCSLHSWTTLSIKLPEALQFSLPAAMENACQKEVAAVSAAMRVGLAKTPCDWQAKQIRSIVRSARAGVVVHLLVQATGGGKSLARDAAARTLGVACLTVSPLLVLGFDQSSKLKTTTRAANGIKVVHLDETAAGSVQEMKLLLDVENLPSRRRKTLLLLSSPQRLDSESCALHLPKRWIQNESNLGCSTQLSPWHVVRHPGTLDPSTP
jgi:hypothetical protein